MSGDWALVIAVLVLGLGAGGVLVWRLGKGGGGRAAGRELELADLERRQEELYARLRAARAEGDEEEVRELEHQAAVNLRDLETLGATIPAAARRSGAADRVLVASAPAAGAAPEAAARHGVMGFVAGVAVAALVGVLVFWAQRDAGPRPGVAQQAMGEEEHPQGAELSAEDRARIEQLRQTLEADPSDLSARKRYALGLLGTGQFFGAFQQAEEILAAVPGDPDGLYVAAMVRLQMGQDEASVELFDAVLAQFPQHVLALTGKGVAMYRAGNELGARVLWQQAKEASGGNNPQVEHLLDMLDARLEEEGEGGAESADGDVPTAPAAAEPAAAGGATATDPSGAVYRVVIRLADGAQPPPHAFLFVTLQGDAPGPPAAVKRLTGSSFPLELTLSAADSMLGRPLPENGIIGARLDGDGNASTRQDGDLAAEAPAAEGSVIELVLRP
jgi:tetratricopeptide (TPR) repeat protein